MESPRKSARTIEQTTNNTSGRRSELGRAETHNGSTFSCIKQPLGSAAVCRLLQITHEHAPVKSSTKNVPLFFWEKRQKVGDPLRPSSN